MRFKFFEKRQPETPHEVPEVPALEEKDNSFPHVLFLDFDGVLHRHNTGTFSKLPLLCTFLREHQSIVVVISSTWRNEFSLQELKEFFPVDLRARIVDTTPLDAHKGSAQALQLGRARSEEISQWLSTHTVQHFAILDDEERLFTAHRSRLVVTDGAEGIGERDLARVAELMGQGRVG